MNSHSWDFPWGYPCHTQVLAVIGARHMTHCSADPSPVFPLISRRKFSQIEVLEGLNVLVCINGRKNKLRVYYLSWLRNKILKGDDVRDA